MTYIESFDYKKVKIFIKKAKNQNSKVTKLQV